MTLGYKTRRSFESTVLGGILSRVLTIMPSPCNKERCSKFDVHSFFLFQTQWFLPLPDFFQGSNVILTKQRCPNNVPTFSQRYLWNILFQTLKNLCSRLTNVFSTRVRSLGRSAINTFHVVLDRSCWARNKGIFYYVITCNIHLGWRISEHFYSRIPGATVPNIRFHGKPVSELDSEPPILLSHLNKASLSCAHKMLCRTAILHYGEVGTRWLQFISKETMIMIRARMCFSTHYMLKGHDHRNTKANGNKDNSGRNILIELVHSYHAEEKMSIQL